MPSVRCRHSMYLIESCPYFTMLLISYTLESRSKSATQNCFLSFPSPQARMQLVFKPHPDTNSIASKIRCSIQRYAGHSLTEFIFSTWSSSLGTIFSILYPDSTNYIELSITLLPHLLSNFVSKEHEMIFLVSL